MKSIQTLLLRFPQKLPVMATTKTSKKPRALQKRVLKKQPSLHRRRRQTKRQEGPVQDRLQDNRAARPVRRDQGDRALSPGAVPGLGLGHDQDLDLGRDLQCPAAPGPDHHHDQCQGRAPGRGPAQGLNLAPGPGQDQGPDPGPGPGPGPGLNLQVAAVTRRSERPKSG